MTMNPQKTGLWISLVLSLTACASDEALFAEYDQLCRSDICLAPATEVIYQMESSALSWEPAVYFGYDLAELSAQEQARLDKNLKVLLAYPDLHVNIQAFTDSTASEAYNLRLSERRRQSVEQYLLDSGTDASRIVSSIAGEMLPILAGDSVLEKAINRRVELMLIDANGVPMSFSVQIPEGPLESGFVPPYPDRKVIEEPKNIEE